MNNLLKGMAALAVLVLLIVLWPRSKPREPIEAGHSATGTATPVSSPAISRPVPTPPRVGPSLRAGQVGLEAGAKAQLARILGGELELPALAREVVESFVERHQRSAESLLGAHHVTRNLDFLKEAAARYPDDPKVQLAVLFHDAFPGQRREWLERFKQSAPDNSLAAYLSARDHLEAKNLPAAVTDLLDATERPRFNPYLLEGMQNVEELLVASGQTPLLAKAEAMFSARMDHLGQLRTLSTELVQLVQQYRTAGDPESAVNLANTGLTLAARLNGSREGQFVIDKLVGIAIENQIWGLFDADASSHYPGLTVQARQEDLARQRETIKSLTADFPTALLACSDSEIIAYLDRVKVLGEVEALRWLRSKQPDN